MAGIEIFVWGFFGGIAAEITILFGAREKFPDQYPHWMKSKAYYALGFLMSLVGGGIALAHVRSGTQLTAILAIQVGASAPLFLRKAGEGLPKPPPQTIDPKRVN